MKLIENHSLFSMPRIGDRAPGFRAVTSQGSIYFPSEFSGKWVILFNHPEDFILSDSIENISIASIEHEFMELNCELIGLSVDGFSCSMESLRTINEKIERKGLKNPEINFRVILDTNMEISKLYSIIHHEESYTNTIRSVFFIDPDRIIRGMTHYPVSIGLNLEEFMRVIIALQTADICQDFMPTNLIQGHSLLKQSAEWYETDRDSAVSKDEKLKSCDCFFCASAFME
jgi:peroxiredoxin (alkyl hydroperoxide reductase subunit C)